MGNCTGTNSTDVAPQTESSKKDNPNPNTESPNHGGGSRSDRQTDRHSDRHSHSHNHSAKAEDKPQEMQQDKEDQPPPKQNGIVRRSSSSKSSPEEPAVDADADTDEGTGESESATKPVAGENNSNSTRGIVIDKAHALTQACDDEEFLIEILGDIMDERNDNLTKIRQAIQENDHKTLSETAHSIKGSALNLALHALSSVSKDLEKLGKDLRNEEDDEKLLQRGPLLDEMDLEYKRIGEFVASEWPDG